MRLEVWLAFVGAAIAISVSPGAGAIQSMATGLSHGLRRGFWNVAGLQMGLMLQLVAVAVGLGAAVAKSPIAFTAIKWLGVGYLVYLAVQQWRTPAGTTEAGLTAGSSVDVEGGPMALLSRGFLVNVTNPKGMVFLLAVLPQFIDPTAALGPQYLAIGLTMLVVDVAVMGAYTGMAARLTGWLRSRRQQVILNRTFACLFAGAALVLSLVPRGVA